MTKITKREMYEALINLGTNGTLTYEGAEGVTEVTTEALVAFAENEITLLDKKTVKAKERAAEKKAEADALMDTVRGLLTEDYQTIADVAAQIADEDVTAAKISYRLTQLVKSGEAEKSEVTIPATETSKARKVCAYKLA